MGIVALAEESPDLAEVPTDAGLCDKLWCRIDDFCGVCCRAKTAAENGVGGLLPHASMDRVFTTTRQMTTTDFWSKLTASCTDNGHQHAEHSYRGWAS